MHQVPEHRMVDPATKPRTRRRVTLVVAAFAAVWVACGPRPARVPGEVPPYSAIDVPASDVHVVDRAHPGKEVGEELSLSIKRDVAAVLLEAERPAPPGRATARFRALVVLEGSHDALQTDGCAAIPGVFGLPTSSERLTVHIAFESGGRTFHGSGYADETGTMYSPAYRHALRRAVERALADGMRPLKDAEARVTEGAP